jgi:hypothetical protein
LDIGLRIISRKELIDVAALDDHESCKIFVSALSSKGALEPCRRMLTDYHDKRERVVDECTSDHASRKDPRRIDQLFSEVYWVSC